MSLLSISIRLAWENFQVDYAWCEEGAFCLGHPDVPGWPLSRMSSWYLGFGEYKGGQMELKFILGSLSVSSCLGFKNITHCLCKWECLWHLHIFERERALKYTAGNEYGRALNSNAQSWFYLTDLSKECTLATGMYSNIQGGKKSSVGFSCWVPDIPSKLVQFLRLLKKNRPFGRRFWAKHRNTWRVFC